MLDVLTELPRDKLSRIRHMRIVARPLYLFDWWDEDEDASAPDVNAMHHETDIYASVRLASQLKFLPGLRLDTLTAWAGNEPSSVTNPPASWQHVLESRDGVARRPSVAIYKSASRFKPPTPAKLLEPLKSELADGVSIEQGRLIELSSRLSKAELDPDALTPDEKHILGYQPLAEQHKAIELIQKYGAEHLHVVDSNAVRPTASGCRWLNPVPPSLARIAEQEGLHDGTVTMIQQELREGESMEDFAFRADATVNESEAHDTIMVVVKRGDGVDYAETGEISPDEHPVIQKEWLEMGWRAVKREFLLGDGNEHDQRQDESRRGMTQQSRHVAERSYEWESSDESGGEPWYETLHPEPNDWSDAVGW